VTVALTAKGRRALAKKGSRTKLTVVFAPFGGGASVRSSTTVKGAAR
jgi:hypothetical protein